MSARPLPTLRQAIFVCAAAVVTVLGCSAVCSAAVIVPAPPAVVPLIVLVCIGCPMICALELPGAVAVLRSGGRNARALASLRRGRERLPETQHPLGL